MTEFRNIIDSSVLINDEPNPPAGTVPVYTGNKNETTPEVTVEELKSRANHIGTQAISTVTGLQAAIDAKATATAAITGTTASFTTEKDTKLSGIATGATANATNSELRDRATHTGTQAISTVTGLEAALEGKLESTEVLENTTASFTTEKDSKLSGVAPGATVNSTDAELRARSSHSGFQAISTITGLQDALDDAITSDTLSSALDIEGALRIVEELPDMEEAELEAVFRKGGTYLAVPTPVVPFGQATSDQILSNSPNEVYMGPQTYTDMLSSTDLGDVGGEVTTDAAGGVNFHGSMTTDTVFNHPTNLKDGEWYSYDFLAKNGARNFKFGTAITVPASFDNEEGADVIEDGALSFSLRTRMLGSSRFTTAYLIENYGVAEEGPEQSIEYITSNSANGDTAAISGVMTGDLIVGIATRSGSATLPTFDTGQGWNRIDGGTWTSAFRSSIAFWKWAESSTPSFGNHTDASRCVWSAYRYGYQISNPIGASAYLAPSWVGADMSVYWTGLTLTKSVSHVLSHMHRAANETIPVRAGDVTSFGVAGVSARYTAVRSNAPVATWPELSSAMSVAGLSQCVAIEIGY